jgi:multicomponent Na+:H+ antiporter subunit D
MGAFTLAALSMAGIPPFVLFTSKFYLGWGAAEVDQQIFMVIYLISGVLAAGYLFPVVYRAFCKRSPDHVAYGEADMRMVAPLAITGVLALFLGIAPNLPFSFFDLASEVARTAFDQGIPITWGAE